MLEADTEIKMADEIDYLVRKLIKDGGNAEEIQELFEYNVRKSLLYYN